MRIARDDSVLRVERPSDERTHRALHGLTRSLVANMVEGVTKGFEKRLEIHGMGYRATLQGTTLTLLLGYSHPIVYEAPDTIEFELSGRDIIIVRGIDKQMVGQVAAEIRAFRKPEPYKGKGIRYVGEVIRRKVGKTAV
jgi:large subunit ribosomal protein L6